MMMDTAMILAAGLGERMRPLTLHTPKPLLSVADKPLLQWHIEHLRAAGIRHLVINCSWLAEKIVDFVQRYENEHLTISLSFETSPLETLGGIVQMLDRVQSEQFLVVNGDVFCDVDFSRFALIDKTLAQLMLVPNPAFHPNGDFALEQSYCKTDSEPRYTFGGAALYHRSFFESCAPGKAPLAPLLREQMQQNRVCGFLHQGYWSDIGTPERLASCDRDIRAREQK